MASHYGYSVFAFSVKIGSMQNISNMYLQWGKKLFNTSVLYGKIGKYFLSFTVQIVKIYT